MRVLILLGLLGAPLAAQAPAGSTTAAPPSEEEKVSHFLFGVPYFLVPKNSRPVAPLSVADKFRITARFSVDPIEFLRYRRPGGHQPGAQP